MRADERVEAFETCITDVRACKGASPSGGLTVAMLQVSAGAHFAAAATAMMDVLQQAVAAHCSAAMRENNGHRAP